MNTSTLIGLGAVGTSLVTNSTVDEKGDIDKAKRNGYITSSILTTATVGVGYTMNANTVRSIQQKYSSAYVESLSDEELATALEKMDLLIAANPEEKGVKTL